MTTTFINWAKGIWQLISGGEEGAITQQVKKIVYKEQSTNNFDCDCDDTNEKGAE